jgi:hypothetical protein
MLASAVKPVACHAKIDEKFTKIQAGGDSYNDKHCLSNRGLWHGVRQYSCWRAAPPGETGRQAQDRGQKLWLS